MFNLLLSTLAMMGLTFLIGFFVAGVIKIIANWADFLDFYSSQREELLSIKKEQKLQQGLAVADSTLTQEHRPFHDRYRKFVHRVHDSVNGLKPRKRIVA